MSRLSIFTKNEQTKFDSPPKLTKKDRAVAFAITEDIKVILSSFRSDTNKAGFLIQLGYFKTSGKFFKPDSFKKEDYFHVATLLSLDYKKIDFLKYTTKSRIAHRNTILKLQAWSNFTDNEKRRLAAEINKHVKQQLHPKQLMHIGINYLLINKVTLPSYHCIADIITDAYNNFENKLLRSITQKLTKYHIEELESLLQATTKENNTRSITFIKKLNQSLKPKKIQVFKSSSRRFYEKSLGVTTWGRYERSTIPLTTARQLVNV